MSRKRRKHATTPSPRPPVAPPPSAPSWLRRRWWLIVVGLLLGFGSWSWYAYQAKQPAVEPGGEEAPTPPAVRYVNDELCADCHRQEYAKWQQSHHAQAMMPATARSVRGDFNDATFTHHGVTTRFFRREGKYFVQTQGADGKPQDFPIERTFGVEPLQQYLIGATGGRMQCLTVAWDTKSKRWFSLYPDERQALDDPLHWTGRYQNWNMMCAECHATNLRKGYDAATDTYQTSWDAPNVGCQACHGPGEKHLAWAEAARQDRVLYRQGKAQHYGLLVHYKANDAHYQVDACAACHSRRQRLTDGEQPDRPFLDNYHPVTLREGLYHADGQQLDEVYVWGSYVQSRMHFRGVRCTDCHDPHSEQLVAPGNAVCTQCHSPQGNRKFLTLTTKNYDTPAHHFHEAGSAGAQCVNCHMPPRNYMVVHARPDHSMRIPRPDLSVKLGTPNACNRCHQDRTPQWAADAVARWYGNNRRKEEHFGEVFAAARAGRLEAESGLLTVARERVNPPLVRATALELLRSYGPRGTRVMQELLADTEPLVRAAAVAGLQSLPPAERASAVAPLLRDPLRLVRIEAARIVLGEAEPQLAAADRSAFDRASRDYLEALRVQADSPGGQLNLAAMHLQRNEAAASERAYRRAVAMDPYLVPASRALAAFLSLRGRNPEAERVLREGLVRGPKQGELHYDLGLLLAEEQRLPEAVAALARAVALRPEDARAQYNHGLALQRSGRRPEAAAALRRANELNPGDPAFAYALAIFHAQDRRWRQALPYAEQAAALEPGNAEARMLLAQVRQQLARAQP